jgi:hypothetical protein
MPILNGRGDVLAGVAGVQGSLNGVPFPFQTFGGGAWLDDNTVLVSIPAPPPLEAVLAIWHPGDAAPTILPENRGANEFAAGGGRYIAWLAGYGCFGSLGHLPAAGVAGRLSVSPDGTIAYIPDRGYGYGLAIVDSDGLAHEVAGIYAGSEQTIRAGVAIWKHGAYGIPVPVPACPDAQNVLVADLEDERWIVYWSDRVGFIAQVDGADDGYILGTTPTFFNHHVRNVDGELLVTWSVTQGEGPSDVVRFLVDRTEPRVRLEAPPVEPPIEPPIEPPPIDPPVEPPDVEPPEPEQPPQQPEVPAMLYIETKFEKTNPALEVEKFDIIKNADGTESYRSVARASSADANVQKTPIYCVTDQGKDEWRENPGGAFESFQRVGQTLVADRFWNNVPNAYIRFCVEAK